MGGSDAESLGVRFLDKFLLFAQRAPQNRIDQRSSSRAGKFHRFEDGRVRRSLKKKQLVDSEAQQIAGITIERAGTKRIDPKVEQRQVTENAVEKLCGEGAIRGRELGRAQETREDGIAKLPPDPPFPKRLQRECSGRRIRHNCRAIALSSALRSHARSIGNGSRAWPSFRG